MRPKILTVLFLTVMVLYSFSTPFLFPTGELIVVPEGHTLSEIANMFANRGVVRSAFAFKLLAKLASASGSLKAGRYIFRKPVPIWEVLKSIAIGDYGTRRIKVSVPEGYSNKQISELVGLDLGEENQGYLFPDTYFFDEFVTIAEVRKTMLDNFASKVASSTPETVIIASILEEEVQSKNDMKIVAGILYKRIKLGMPLQVDSVPWTYQNEGLPPVPVSNSGLQALEAARIPETSSYLYYLSDKDGLTHYAKTFEEHKVNKARYLR